MRSQSFRLRRRILELAANSSEGHVPSCFSVVEMLLAVVEFESKLGKTFTPGNLILSKGHATYAWYALLDELGLFSSSEVDSVGMIGSKLYGHLPFLPDDPRFVFGSGSLGHGLPFALGLTLGMAIDGNGDNVYVLVGDGECNEGTFWESLLLLQKFSCDYSISLKILIDMNKSSERAIPIEKSLKYIGAVFDNLALFEHDGHNVNDIVSGFVRSKGCASIHLCRSAKGFPLSDLASPRFHHSKITESMLQSLKLKLFDFYCLGNT